MRGECKRVKRYDEGGEGRRKMGSKVYSLVKKSLKTGIAAAASTGLVLSAAACSQLGDSSRAQIADALLGSADFSQLHSLGYSDADVEDIAVCTADALQEILSAESLTALAEGNFDKELPKKDYDALTSAMMDCSLEKNTGETSPAV